MSDRSQKWLIALWLGCSGGRGGEGLSLFPSLPPSRDATRCCSSTVTSTVTSKHPLDFHLLSFSSSRHPIKKQSLPINILLILFLLLSFSSWLSQFSSNQEAESAHQHIIDFLPYSVLQCLSYSTGFQINNAIASAHFIHFFFSMLSISIPTSYDFLLSSL